MLDGIWSLGTNPDGRETSFARVSFAPVLLIDEVERRPGLEPVFRDID